MKDYAIDGLRLDTVTYVPRWFLEKFQQRAGVYIVGEVRASQSRPAVGTGSNLRCGCGCRLRLRLRMWMWVWLRLRLRLRLRLERGLLTRAR